MDLNEFRERARRGEKQRDAPISFYLEYMQVQFDLHKEFYAQLGAIGVCMPINVDDDADLCFVYELTSTTHDAFVFYNIETERFVEPFTLEHASEYEGLTMITFFPKGATREEITSSVNACWLERAQIVDAAPPAPPCDVGRSETRRDVQSNPGSGWCILF